MVGFRGIQRDRTDTGGSRRIQGDARDTRSSWGIQGVQGGSSEIQVAQGCLRGIYRIKEKFEMND